MLTTFFSIFSYRSRQTQRTPVHKENSAPDARPMEKPGIRRIPALSLLCLLLAAAAQAQLTPVLQVGTNLYSPFSTGLAPGTFVYVDADPATATPLRASQRCLGYREVDYKSLVPATLYFSAATPATNGTIVSYDYTAQANKTNLVGFWANKDVPMVIGPDGLAYATDGHHTTAAYLAPASPVRQIIPGQNRVILGHIVANFFQASAGPQPVDDAWWTARAAENNALLYGPEGDQLVLPGEPNYSGLQPILPSLLAMPSTPSALTTNGAVAMTPSAYRGLAWGLADAIVVSATDAAAKKIAGYKKSAPGSSVDINFVEFFWSDYLRHRVVWDDTLAGSPLASGNGDASATAAPLSFFIAVANCIALARSQAYRDEFGRRIFDYTNASVFPPNTVNWANGSISNGLAAATDTYHLYMRDDSGIAGTVSPSPLSTNILHLDTVAGMTVTQALENISTVLINAGGTLKTSWKDAPISNTTLRLPAGSGVVTVAGTNFVAANSILGGGTLLLTGTLRGNAQVTNGTLTGSGAVNGNVSVSAAGTLSPGPVLTAFHVNGGLTLGGALVMKSAKTGVSMAADAITGISSLRYGGSLTLLASGDEFADGDAVKLFDAASYSGAFSSFNLPPLNPGLYWDTTRLLTDGTVAVTSHGVIPTVAAQPADRTVNVGATVTLTAGAVGTLPITYQWLFNGTNLTGQTGLSVVLANIPKSGQGPYAFVAQNSSGAVTSAPVTITVNQLPVAAPDQVATKQNQALAIAVAALLANDSDADGDPLSLTSVSATSTNGSAISLNAGIVTYTPKAGFVGADRFTYNISDGRGGTVQGSVAVNVNSSNLPPAGRVTLTLGTTSRIIRFGGVPLRKYAVQKSDNVTGPWANLSPDLTAAADGLVEFLDNDPLASSRFYQVISVGP